MPFKSALDLTIIISEEWGGSVEYASYSGGADLIADNHLDVFAFSVGKLPPL